MVEVLGTRVAGGEGSMKFGSGTSSITRRGDTGMSLGYSAVTSTSSFWNGSVSNPKAGSSIETLCVEALPVSVEVRGCTVVPRRAGGSPLTIGFEPCPVADSSVSVEANWNEVERELRRRVENRESDRRVRVDKGRVGATMRSVPSLNHNHAI